MTRGLFAVTGSQSSLSGHLLMIDPNSGAATDIGSLGISNTNCGGAAGIVGDITFRADGRCGELPRRPPRGLRVVILAPDIDATAVIPVFPPYL
jgi:hypothetical protein